MSYYPVSYYPGGSVLIFLQSRANVFLPTTADPAFSQIFPDILETKQQLVRSQNLSNEHRTLDALLSSSSIYYTGVTANPISRAHGEFVLAPGQSKYTSLDR